MARAPARCRPRVPRRRAGTTRQAPVVRVTPMAPGGRSVARPAPVPPASTAHRQPRSSRRAPSSARASPASARHPARRDRASSDASARSGRGPRRTPSPGRAAGSPGEPDAPSPGPPGPSPVSSRRPQRSAPIGTGRPAQCHACGPSKRLARPRREQSGAIRSPAPMRVRILRRARVRRGRRKYHAAREGAVGPRALTIRSTAGGRVESAVDAALSHGR